MAKAVVSTGVGAEGLPVEDGRHLLIADEPNTFARSVVRLLRDVNRRREIEAAARALVIENYDWSAVAGSLEESLIRIARVPAFTSDIVPRSVISNPQVGESQ